MSMKIAILEDNPERVAAMTESLQDRFYMFEARFFDSAVEMKSYLEGNLDEIILISLDHDLDLKQSPKKEYIDPGTGRDIADFLAKRTPVCPVVIHSTNTDAVCGMEIVLQDAHWDTFRVIPFDDLAWISKEWLPTVRRAIVRPHRLLNERHTR